MFILLAQALTCTAQEDISTFDSAMAGTISVTDKTIGRKGVMGQSRVKSQTVYSASIAWLNQTETIA
jgi:hypothetical protein